jgi:predicted Rossmann-fold nucleotide-binding protein
MRRREFIAFLGGAAVTLSGPAWPQEPGRTYRLGVLTNAPRDAVHWLAFFDELRRQGFIEGTNLEILDGFSAPADRVDAFAAKMVEARPDVTLPAAQR